MKDAEDMKVALRESNLPQNTELIVALACAALTGNDNGIQNSHQGDVKQ